MAVFLKRVRDWLVPAVGFVAIVLVLFLSLVRMDRHMEGVFLEDAMGMARIMAQVMASQNPEAGLSASGLTAFMQGDPRILGVRLYGEGESGRKLLLDAAPGIPLLAEPSREILEKECSHIERLAPFPDQASLFQIAIPLSDSRTFLLFMARKQGASLPYVQPLVLVSLLIFSIIIASFVWYVVWMRRELKARSNVELALSRKSRTDEIFARYARSLILADNMEEAALYVLDAAQELTGSRVGYAGYMDPLTGHLFCPVGSGQLDARSIMKPELLVLETFSGVWGEVLQHGHPLYASADSGRVLSIPTRDGQMAVSSLLSVPAMAGGKLVGQITVGDASEAYTDGSLRVMEKLADLFALSIRKGLAAKELRESESRFRVVFKTIPDAVVLTRLSDHMLVDANDGFMRLTGFTTDEIRGRTAVSLGFWADDEDRNTFVERLHAHGKLENLETRFRIRDGRIIHALISGSKTFLHGELHCLSVIRGVDHIREAEFKLRKERSFLSKVVETSPAGIVAVDAMGRIIFANQKIAEILGMDIPTILEHSFYDERWDVTDHDLRPVAREDMVFFRIRNQRAPLYNVRHTVKDGRGQRIYLSINAAILWREDGRMDMIVAALEDVSEQVRRQHSLVEARNQLESVLANLPVILWAIDREGRITLFEGKGTQSVAMPEGGMLGLPARERYAGLPLMLQSIDRVLSGETVSITAQIGGYYFEVMGAPLLDHSGTIQGASGVAADVTARVQAEVDHIRLSAAIEQVVESIVVTDRQATILYVNPAFERVTGWTRDEVVGQTPAILKSGYHKQGFYAEMWRTLLSGRVWQGYITNRKKDGSCYDEEVSISPILDKSGNIINFVAVKRDVTQERNLERQLRQAQKMEAIGTLAGGIAHDFNNILFPIIGFTELALEHTAKDRPEIKYLKSILTAANRARDLVWQILTFSRKNDDGEQRRPVTVAPVVKEALKLLRASIPSTIEIRHDIENSDMRVLADPTQIHQVVMNLCTNAFHAMENGGLMRVALESLHLEEGRPADVHPGVPGGTWQMLSVSDTGVGMDTDILERVFDPYFTTKEQGKGTGLGLATVHGIVRGCGGEIKVASAPGEGTVFRVYLPMTCSEETQSQRERADAVVGGRGRILLVDDETLIVEMLQDTLEDLGYEVTGCWSSTEALEIFRRIPDSFDLLITDQTMPKMTGTVLAAEVQKIRPGFPVILCSGFSDPLNRETLNRGGIVECVMKPVLRKEVARAVSMAMEKVALVGREGRSVSAYDSKPV